MKQAWTPPQAPTKALVISYIHLVEVKASGDDIAMRLDRYVKIMMGRHKHHSSENLVKPSEQAKAQIASIYSQWVRQASEMCVCAALPPK